MGKAIFTAFFTFLSLNVNSAYLNRLNCDKLRCYESGTNFDRTNLISINKGNHNFSKELPVSPKTISKVTVAGNVTPANASFNESSTKFGAEEVISYFKDENKPVSTPIGYRHIDLNVTAEQ